MPDWGCAGGSAIPAGGSLWGARAGCADENTYPQGRVLFLDHRVVELALGISERVKTRGGGLKPVLKKAVRGVIPDDLIERPKQGFGVPLNSWFAGRVEALSTPVLDRFCREAGLLDPEGLRALSERSKGRRIWPLWNLALWWQEFIA